MSEFTDIQNEILPVAYIRNIHHQPVGVFEDGDSAGIRYSTDVNVFIKENLTSTDELPRWFNIPLFTEHVKLYTIRVVSSRPGSWSPSVESGAGFRSARYRHEVDDYILEQFGDPRTRKLQIANLVRQTAAEHGHLDREGNVDWAALRPDWRQGATIFSMLEALFNEYSFNNSDTKIDIKEVSIREIKSGFEIGNRVVGREDFVRGRADVQSFHSVNSLSGDRIYDIPYLVKFNGDDDLFFAERDSNARTKHVSYFSFLDLDIYGLGREINLNMIDDWYNGDTSQSLIMKFSGPMLYNNAWQNYSSPVLDAMNESGARAQNESYDGPPRHTYVYYTTKGEQYFGSVNIRNGIFYTGPIYNVNSSVRLQRRSIRNQTITWSMMDRSDWISSSIGDPFFDLSNPFNLGFGEIDDFPETISSLSLAKGMNVANVALDKAIRSRVIDRQRTTGNSDGVSEKMIHSITRHGGHKFGFFLEVDDIIKTHSKYRGMFNQWGDAEKRAARERFEILGIEIYRKRADVDTEDDVDFDEGLVMAGKDIRTNSRLQLTGYSEKGRLREENLATKISDVAPLRAEAVPSRAGNSVVHGPITRFVTFSDYELSEKTDGKYSYYIKARFTDPMYEVLSRAMGTLENDIKRLRELYDYVSAPASTSFFDEADFSLLLTQEERLARQQAGNTLGTIRDFTRASPLGSEDDASQAGPNPGAIMLAEKGAYNYRTGMYNREFVEWYLDPEREPWVELPSPATLRLMAERFRKAVHMIFPEFEVVSSAMGTVTNDLQVAVADGERYGSFGAFSAPGGARRRAPLTDLDVLNMISPESEVAKPEHLLKFTSALESLVVTLQKLLGGYISPEGKIDLDGDNSAHPRAYPIIEYRKEYRNVIDVNKNYGFGVYYLPLADNSANIASEIGPQGPIFPVITKSQLEDHFQREFDLNSAERLRNRAGRNLAENGVSHFYGWMLPSKYYYQKKPKAYSTTNTGQFIPDLRACVFNNHNHRFFTTRLFTVEHNKVYDLYSIYRPSYGFVGTSKKDVRHAYVPHEEVLIPEVALEVRRYARARYNLADFNISIRWNGAEQVHDPANEEENLQSLERLLPEDVFERLSDELATVDNENLGNITRTGLREIKEYERITRMYGKVVKLLDKTAINFLTPTLMEDVYASSLHTRRFGPHFRPFKNISDWDSVWDSVYIGPRPSRLPNHYVVPPQLFAAAADWPRPVVWPGQPPGRLVAEQFGAERQTDNLSYFYHGMIAKILVYTGESGSGYMSYEQLTKQLLDQIHERQWPFLLCKISFYENNYFGVGPSIFHKHIPIIDQYFMVDLNS